MPAPRGEPAVRVVGRTVVVAAWLVALALAGSPGWAAVLLGAVLVAVWAAPALLRNGRRPVTRRIGTGRDSAPRPT